MKYLKEYVILIISLVQTANAEVIYDESRQRSIPVEITFPAEKGECSTTEKCPVAFLSAGYGVPHSKYTFLASELNRLGYLVVAIGHELPSDPVLSVAGNLYETRSENWRRGAQTLDFLKHRDLSDDLSTLCKKLNIPLIASGKKITTGEAVCPPT